jgi:putative PEP-CTERM system TPR-repeat lipoprotein
MPPSFPLRATLLAVSLAAALSTLALSGCSQHSATELRAEAGRMRAQGDLSSAIITLKNALQAEPHSAEARYQLAQVYLETGEALSAEKEARRALGDGYARTPALAALGKALVLQGEYKKALAELDKAGDAPALLPVRADALLALGQRDAAFALLDALARRAPNSPEALIGLGRIAWADGERAQALAYGERVLAADPNNTDALMFKADLLRAQDQPAKAVALYDRVLKLRPQHRSAHVEKAFLAIGLERYADAQAELDAAARIAPNSMLVAYTQALLDTTRGKPEAAQESLLKVLRVAPEHMPSVLLAGAVSLRLGSWYMAEHHFRHYLERNPDNLYARKMLASALLGSGHDNDALEALGPAIKRGRVDAQLLALAGESNLRVRRFDQATDLFEQASALDPASSSMLTSLGLSKLAKGDNDGAVRHLQAAAQLDRGSLQAGLALIRTELKLDRPERALAAAQALEQAQPNSAAVQELKGLVHAAQHDAGKARAAFARALALDPAYFPAAADQAQLAVDAGQPQAARQALLDFLGHNKDSVDAMSALATLADGTHQPQEALDWLKRAQAVDPHAVAPAVNLIAQYLRTGANQKALTLARTLHVEHPENPDLLDLLGKSELANGEHAAALESYKALALALPRSSQVLMQVAALHVLLNRPREAEDELKGVLAMQPDFPAAQLELAEVYVRKGSPDLALLIAGHMQRLHPKGAAGYQLEGDILMAKGQAAPAQQAYETAFSLLPNVELAIKLDNALRRAGRKPDADRRLALWLAAHPDDLRAQAYRAQAWMAERQFGPAASQLEAIVARAPGNAAALNNLALAYQALGDARALSNAEAALAAGGEQPAVLDTLAWILAARDDVPRALALLQKAHLLAPRARDIRYHLAAVLYKSGAKEQARKELEALAAGDMRFAEADEVRSLLAEVRQGG